MNTRRLIVASNNKGKIREMEAILAPYFAEILSQSAAGVHLEVEEDGTTFQENAVKKAEAIASLLQCAAVADDSGLCVDALGGAPGVYSARYAGEHGNDAANTQKLLAALRDVPDAARGAYFASAIALARPGLPTLVVEGRCPGRIARAPRGENGFGYDPVFLLPDRDVTFAELAPEHKNAISHRAIALAKMLQALQREEAGR
nr:XTP/dITP diphosphatase [Maliibacterium massiliense]